MGNIMAELVCKKRFVLNTPEGNKVYNVGDKVEGKAAEHWYAKAHCVADADALKKSESRDPVKDAFETRKILAQLSDDGTTPNMKEVQKALRDAGLPALENAEARDTMLADIAKEKAKANPELLTPAPAAPAEGGDNAGGNDSTGNTTE
jgi:hypothetical protein